MRRHLSKQGPSDTAPKESKMHPEKHNKPGNLSHTEEIFKYINISSYK